MSAGRRLLFAAGLAAVLVPAVVIGWSMGVSRFWDAPTAGRLAYANERSMGVEVIDGRGRYLGMVHYSTDSMRDIVEYQDIEQARRDKELTARIEQYDIRPDHKTIHVTPEEVPPYFWSCLIYLEDRWLGAWWRNPAGIDFVTAFKIPFNGDGGSTVPMMISRHMRKTLPSAEEPVQQKIWRKVTEWREAPTMWRMLGSSRDNGGLRAWAAQHVVLLTNLGGSGPDITPDVYGVETAGRVLFGHSVEELTPAEQMMLAASYRRPLVPVRPRPATAPEDWRNRPLERWQAIADRAAVCARDEAGVIPQAKRAEIRAELKALRDSPRAPVVDDALTAASVSLNAPAADAAFKTRLEHPYSRLRLLMPRPHRRFMVGLLTDRFGNNWRDQVRRVSLTLDAERDLRFQQTMSRAWAQFEAANRSGWLLSAASERQMGYLAVAADEQGRIVRFFEGGVGPGAEGVGPPRFEGGSARYPGAWNQALSVEERGRRCQPGQAPGADGLCPFEPRSRAYPRTGRDMASIGKVLAALALADVGASPTKEAVQAFALSQNKPVADMLGRVAPARLRELMGFLDIELPAEAGDLRQAVSWGRIRATPRAVHRMTGLALAVARGRFDQSVPMPTIVERYDMFDATRMTASMRASPDAVDAPLTAEALFHPKDEADREAMTRYVRQTLSAPVCGGGTLRTLAKWCPGGPNGVKLHIAKTGTRAAGRRSDEARPETVDIWIAGGVEFADGRAYTYVVLAGTDQPLLPFHSSTLNAAAASNVVDALLADLAVDKPPASLTSLPNASR